MADVTVNTDTNNPPIELGTRWTVFKNALTGYCFQFAADRDLYYEKTTDGGATWGTRVSVFVGVGGALDVWYDQWTPSDTGTKIHLNFIDANNNIYYANLETATDTLSTPLAINNTATFVTSTWGFRYCNITKARGGNLYVAFHGDSGAALTECWRSIDGGANWTVRADPQRGASNYVLMLPGAETDANDIVAWVWDGSANAIYYRRYDDSLDTWDETLVNSDHGENNSAIGWSGGIRHSDNNVFLIAWSAYPDIVSADLRVYQAHQGTVTNRTNIVTDTDDMGGCTLYIDQSRGRLYVGMIGKSDGSETFGTSVNVYYVISNNNGISWSNQTQYNTTATAINHISSDMGARHGRFYPIFHTGDLMGNFDNSVLIAPSGGSPPRGGGGGGNPNPPGGGGKRDKGVFRKTRTLDNVL